MIEPGSTRQSSGRVRSNPMGSANAGTQWSDAMPFNRLIRFKPFSYAGPQPSGWGQK